MLIKELLREDDEISRSQLKLISQYADRLFKAAGLDIIFTNHFLDRANDPRNLKPITARELVDVFNKVYKQLDHGKEIARLGPEAQAVLKDMEKDINMPFVLKWDDRSQELDLVFKTVMRKRNFMSSNPTLKVENKYTMRIKDILLEGGNVWPDITPFSKEQASEILKTLQKIMPKGVELIKVGSAGHKPISGDMDVMVDENKIIKLFKPQIEAVMKSQQTAKKKMTPVQIARQLFKEYFEKKGFQAALSGVNVHVRVPVGKTIAQVDIMFVEDAANVSIFHQHDYNSEFAGKHKQMLLSSIAKETKTTKYPYGMMWSAFQGLFSRDKNGKKDQLITRDPDIVAKLLLNPNAHRKDLANVESVIAALKDDNLKTQKLQAFRADLEKEKLQ